MKVRNGFVSNSSSSSFVICTNNKIETEADFDLEFKDKFESFKQPQIDAKVKIQAILDKVNKIRLDEVTDTEDDTEDSIEEYIRCTLLDKAEKIANENAIDISNYDKDYNEIPYFINEENTVDLDLYYKMLKNAFLRRNNNTKNPLYCTDINASSEIENFTEKLKDKNSVLYKSMFEIFKYVIESNCSSLEDILTGVGIECIDFQSFFDFRSCKFKRLNKERINKTENEIKKFNKKCDLFSSSLADLFIESLIQLFEDDDVGYNNNPPKYTYVIRYSSDDNPKPENDYETPYKGRCVTDTILNALNIPCIRIENS